MVKKRLLTLVFVVLFSLINIAQTSLQINVKNNKKGCTLEKKVIIPYKYKEIIIKNELILTKDFSNRWKLFTINGKKLLKGRSFQKIEIYEKIIVCQKNKNFFEIYKDDVKLTTANEASIEGDSLILLSKGDYYSIINFNGVFIVPENIYDDVMYNEEFDCIQVSSYDDNFKLKNKNGIGSTTRATEMVGLIDAKTGEIKIPCVFNKLKRDKDGQIWVKKQRTFVGEKIKWEKYP